MIITKMLVGDMFYSLVLFTKNANDDLAVKSLKENIFFGNLLNGKIFPSSLSIISFIAIIFLLNVSFILPFMTIMFNSHAPVSVAAPLTFISAVSFSTVSFISFWLISRGRWSGMVIFCCMIGTVYSLFLSSLLFHLFTNNFYWSEKIINICTILLNRRLMNAQPFNEIVKNYIYMRLFMAAMDKLRHHTPL